MLRVVTEVSNDLSPSLMDIITPTWLEWSRVLGVGVWWEYYPLLNLVTQVTASLSPSLMDIITPNGL